MTGHPIVNCGSSAGNKRGIKIEKWKFSSIRTENGERRTENGERRTENGERRTENGERRFLSISWLYLHVKFTSRLYNQLLGYCTMFAGKVQAPIYRAEHMEINRRTDGNQTHYNSTILAGEGTPHQYGNIAPTCSVR